MKLVHRPAYLTTAYYDALLADARGNACTAVIRSACDAQAGRLPGTAWTGGSGLAILVQPGEALSPTDDPTNALLLSLARQHGMKAELIGFADLERLHLFDALFIRAHTSPNGDAYRFASLAQKLGMPVLDDPDSIPRCCNKVYQAERFRTLGIAAPATLIVSANTPIADIENALSYPVILKEPDGSFSRGVFRANDRAELQRISRSMLEHSHMIVAQAFVPTTFDWRICVLQGEILFACKYQMASGHWQILKQSGDGIVDEGGFEAIGMTRVPAAVSALALAAAASIGQGLYGIDIKETTEGPVVIEVNDNPDIKHGIEDSAEGIVVWLKILSWFGLRMLLRTRSSANLSRGKRTSSLTSPLHVASRAS